MASLPVRMVRAVLRVLRDLARGLLFLTVGLLAADLLAVTLVGPTLLTGPAAGVPVTGALLVLAGYGVRRLVVSRRSPDERRQVAARVEAAQRLRQQKWARRLRLLRIAPTSRTGYREALPEVGVIGYLVGLAVGWSVFLVIVRVGSLGTALVVLFAVAALGVVAAVEYEVHLAEPLRRWRCRRLARRLIGSTTGGAVVADAGVREPDAWDLGDITGDDGGGGCGSGD